MGFRTCSSAIHLRHVQGSLQNARVSSALSPYHSMANGKFGVVQDSEDSLINMMTANGLATPRKRKRSFANLVRPRYCQTTHTADVLLLDPAAPNESDPHPPYDLATWEGYINILGSSRSRTPTSSCATSATPSGKNSPKHRHTIQKPGIPREDERLPQPLRPRAARYRPARHLRRADAGLCRPRVRNQEPSAGPMGKGLPTCAE